MKTLAKLDDFTKGYIAAMYWTEEEAIGSDCELTEEALDDVKNECIQFYQGNAELLSTMSPDFSQHGHDFWLTRNGHGAGFWDRGYDEDSAQAMTLESQRYGSAYIESDDRITGRYHSDSEVGMW